MVTASAHKPFGKTAKLCVSRQEEKPEAYKTNHWLVDVLDLARQSLRALTLSLDGRAHHEG